jgi:hypothetical protein
MKTLEFERLERGTYKVFLHAGGYTIPVTDEVLKHLMERITSPPEAFLNAVVDMVGYNRYLKDLLQEAIREKGDPSHLGKSLQDDLSKF